MPGHRRHRGGAKVGFFQIKAVVRILMLLFLPLYSSSSVVMSSAPSFNNGLIPHAAAAAATAATAAAASEAAEAIERGGVGGSPLKEGPSNNFLEVKSQNHQQRQKRKEEEQQEVNQLSTY